MAARISAMKAPKKVHVTWSEMIFEFIAPYISAMKAPDHAF